MRREFYELRSWDTETGLLKKETFRELDLMDIAETMSRGVAN
jgi:hypothetical protein